MSYYDCDETDRAVEAYFQWCQTQFPGVTPTQPNRYDTGRVGDVITIRGGGHGSVLARFRVLPDGGHLKIDD